MNEKISNYYKYYLRGQYLAASNKPDNHRKAIEEYLKAIDFKETKQVCRAILNLYIKLNDIVNIIKYSEKAYEFGDINAMHYLGLIFYQGNYIEQDFERAYECFSKCIEHKYVPSYVSLAKMYLNGEYVNKDENKFLECLNEAIKIKNNGNIGEPLECLGLYYYGKEDYEMAIKYFKKSIKHGWLHSNYYLALCYKEGNGVKKDLDKYMEHLLAFYCKETYMELSQVFSDKNFIEPDKYLFETSVFCLAKTGDPIGAFILATIYSTKKPYNEKLINYLLDKSLSEIVENGLSEKVIDSLKSCVDPIYHDDIDEMIKKYLDSKRYEA